MKSAGKNDLLTVLSMVHHRPGHRLALLFLPLFILAQSTLPVLGGPPAEKPIRLGFSIHLFSGINETDARAAVRTLTTTISRNKSIPANPDPYVTQTIDQAEQCLLSGEIDVFGMTTEEYRLLLGRVDFDKFLFTSVEEKSEEVFLVLAHKLGTARTLSDLRGKQLLLHAGPRTHLATPWLDLELQKIGQPETSHFFGTIEESTKPGKVVLPVFFRKTDACLITQRSFQTVAEMNPQVAAELHVIARSPPFVPLVIAFRKTLPPSLGDRVYQEFLKLHTTTYGQQGLMIFQTQRIVEHPLTVLNPAMEMLEKHERLCVVASAARRVKFNQPPPPPQTRL